MNTNPLERSFIYNSIQEACNYLGVRFKPVAADGFWHTTDLLSDANNSGNGRIILKPNGYGTVYNWKISQFANFKESSFVNQSPTILKKAFNKTNANLKSALEACEAATTHPYLNNKCLDPLNCYILKQELVKNILGYQPQASGNYLSGDLLVVPFFNYESRLYSLQLIDKDGSKVFVARSTVKGAFWASDSPQSLAGEQPIFIAEGLATALSVKRATNQTSLATGGINNLLQVAKMLKQKLTNPLFIIADISLSDGLPDKNLVAEALSLGLAVIYPQIKEAEGGTDFNDLMLVSGIEEVRNQITTQLEALKPSAINSSPNLSKTDLKEKLTDSDKTDIAQKVLQNYAYVNEIERFVDLEDSSLLDENKLCKQFANQYLLTNKKNPKLSNLVIEKALRYIEIKSPNLEDVRFFDRLNYMPGSNSRCVLEGNKVLLNTWKPSNIESKEGDVTPFVEHMLYLFKEKEAEILINYLAHLVQNPGEKVMWAPLIQGAQGIGKSYIGWVIKLILGEHNISIPTHSDLHSDYSDWQVNCQLIIIEELMATGRREIANKLKPLITQATTRINIKYLNAFNYPNRFNFLMFTNHTDAIKLEESDRRYFILVSDVVPKAEKYYKNLFDWSESNIGIIYNYLLTKNISDFSPKGTAPLTEGKEIVFEAGLNSAQSFFYEKINNQETPFEFDIVSSNQIKKDLRHTEFHHLSASNIGVILRFLGCRFLGVFNIDGKSQRLIIIRDYEFWEKQDKEEIKKEFFKNVRNVHSYSYN